MKSALKTEARPRLCLQADTAADLMTHNPVSLRADALVHEAVSFLTEKGFSAAPVLDDAGRPIGVLSQTDLLVHDREKVEYVPDVSEDYLTEEISSRGRATPPGGLQVVNVDHTRVDELMTPAVFSTAPETPVHTVIEEMLALKVHRLFVVDHQGILIGVITALDVLRHLKG